VATSVSSSITTYEEWPDIKPPLIFGIYEVLHILITVNNKKIHMIRACIYIYIYIADAPVS
jgi:hypothetical protein